MGINNRNYNTDGVVQDTPKVNKDDVSPAKSFSLAKVFGYMFSALLVTAAMAFLFGYLFSMWINKGGQNAASAISVILAITSIATIITMLIMNFVCLKKGKGVKTSFYIFAALMGITLSTLVMFMPWMILGVAFGATSLVFALMWGIAAIGKEKLAPLAVVGFGLLLGAGIVALISWIVILCNPGIDTTFVWIIDLVVFGAIMLITIVDIARIQTICKAGEVSDDLAVFCACTLYVDFIYIFVRLVYFIAIAYARNK